jgi:hypothetical protein
LEISKLNPSFILDADKIDEAIHLSSDIYIQKNNLYYTKFRYLDIDFKGIPIPDKHNYIRTKTLWLADLLNGVIEEIIPYGFYDIQGIHIAQNYLYFVKIFDKDGDGLLGEEDYSNGAEIWRLDKFSKIEEFCFDLKDKYIDFTFQTVNDDVIVFSWGDEITNITFVDLSKNRKTTLLNYYDNEFDFKFVEDEKNNPTHFITKKWISEGETSSPSHILKCITWADLMSQLRWETIQ